VAALAVGLLGVAASPAMAGKSVSPASWNFGTLPIGATSSPKSFTLTVTCVPSLDGVIPCQNPDNFSPVVSTTGDYAVVGNSCPAMMSAGPSPAYPPSQSCTVTVTFGPTSAGNRSGTLQTGGPTAALSGFAPLPVAAPTPTPPTPTPTPAPKKCKKHRRAAAAKKRCKKKH